MSEDETAGVDIEGAVEDDMRSRPLWERLPPRKLTAREIAATLPVEAVPEGEAIRAYGYTVPGSDLDGSEWVAFVVEARSFHHLHCSERGGWERVEASGNDTENTTEARKVATELLDADDDYVSPIALLDPQERDAAFDTERLYAEGRPDSGPWVNWSELPADEATELRGGLYLERAEAERVDEDELKEPQDPLEQVIEQAKAESGRLHETIQWAASPGNVRPIYVGEGDYAPLEDTDHDAAGAEVRYENGRGVLEVSTFGDRPLEGTDGFAADAGDRFTLVVRRDGDDLHGEVFDDEGDRVAGVAVGGVFKGDAVEVVGEGPKRSDAGTRAIPVAHEAFENASLSVENNLESMEGVGSLEPQTYEGSFSISPAHEALESLKQMAEAIEHGAPDLDLEPQDGGD